MDEMLTNRTREELLQQKDMVNAEIGRRKRRGEPIDDLLQRSAELSAQLKTPAKPQSPPAPAAITTSVVTSSAAVTALRDEWRALAALCPATHLYATWEWADAWYAVHEARGGIHCLLVRDGAQRLIGLAPLFIPDRGDGNLATNQAGFLGTWGPSWGNYPEFLVNPEHEQAAFEAIISHLAEVAGSWRGLKLMRMKPSSPTLSRLAEQAAGQGLQLYVRPGLSTALAPLPDDPDQVVETYPRKHRSDSRRALRHLAEDHPRARFGAFSGGDEALRLLDAVKELNIARRRSQSTDSHFARPDYRACHDRAGRSFLEAGWVRCAGLFEGDEVISATYGAVYGDCLYVISSGFRPEYARYDPSHLVLLHLTQQAVREGLRWMDMLTWYPYKSALCPIREQLVDVTLFPDEYPGLATVATELLQRSARLAVKRFLGIRPKSAAPAPGPAPPRLALQ